MAHYCWDFPRHSSLVSFFKPRRLDVSTHLRLPGQKTPISPAKFEHSRTDWCQKEVQTLGRHGPQDANDQQDAFEFFVDPDPQKEPSPLVTGASCEVATPT